MELNKNNTQFLRIDSATLFEKTSLNLIITNNYE